MSSTKMTEKHVHIFYETLSYLLTEKYGVEITITAIKKDEFKNENEEEQQNAKERIS